MPVTSTDLPSAIQQHAAKLMQQQQIPGMAVAVLWQGKHYVYSFGLADVAGNTPVTPETLFEIGSVTKTFNGVLSALAIARGDIRLHDPVSQHWPELRGLAWQKIQLLHLATYTAGGLPLQFPPEVTDERSMLHFYQQWQPAYSPGAQRIYANTSIGLFGHLAVKHSKQPYAEVLTQQLLTPLQLTQTYTQVPSTAQTSYASGYVDGKAVRHQRGMLSDEAGGMKSSVHDLARWLQLHLTPSTITEPQIRQAMHLAQQRYAKAGQMYQGLGWEMLDYPTSLSHLQAMTDRRFTTQSPAQLLQPAAPATAAAWVHKTGSTTGFAAYVAMIPSQHAGMVILANHGYPNALRVEFAHHILQGLIDGNIHAATP
jgi:CubicO group peptidase (beta-lactamase class C family)